MPAPLPERIVRAVAAGGGRPVSPHAALTDGGADAPEEVTVAAYRLVRAGVLAFAGVGPGPDGRGPVALFILESAESGRPAVCPAGTTPLAWPRAA